MSAKVINQENTLKVDKNDTLKWALSLKVHVMIMILLSVILACVLLYGMAWFNLDEVFTGMTEDKAINMARIVKQYVDVEELKAGIEEASDENTYIISLNQMLGSIREATGISYVYIVQDAGANVSNIVDGYANDDPEHLPLGTIESKDDYDDIDVAFIEGAEKISDIYSYSEDGIDYLLISAYIPIKDARGNVIAVLGCDIDTTENNQELNEMLSSFQIAVVILLVLFIVVNFLICLYRFRPLSQMVQYIEVLGRGDFTSTYNYRKRDEIGKIANALNYLSSNLKNTLSITFGTSAELKASTDILDDSLGSITAVVQNVTGAIGSLAESTVEQSHSTESGMNNINELNESIMANARNLEDFMSQLDIVSESKDEGLKAVEELNAQSEMSSTALQKMSSDIMNTSESVKRIGVASTAIREIASQTNLLALNASIEASRAGEAGRGFSVVADEIRGLSEKSNESVGEINIIIGELLKNSENMVATMENLEAMMNRQSQYIEVTEDKFKQINNSVQGTQSSIVGLRQSAEVMSGATDEIVSIFKNLTQDATGNAASTEEISASMQEQTALVEEIADMATKLNEKSKELDESLSSFKF